MAIDLNYKPKVIVSTVGMDEKTWLEYRRKGIGGSDVGAIFGCSPFKTMRGVYYDKLGILPLEEESNWVAKEVGHRLEDLVAEIFEKKTGFILEKDQRLLSHPFFSFMQANIDYLLYTIDGECGILECKTSSIYNKEKWSNDAIPEHYELQVRHYLSVLNLNFAYIACLFGNSESDFVIRKITRDLSVEQELIANEDFFWNKYVLQKVEPPFIDKPEKNLACLKSYYRPSNSLSEPFEIPKEYSTALDDYMKMKKQKADLEKQSKELKEQMEVVYTPIIDLMRNNSMAFCEGSHGVYHISHKPTERTTLTKEGFMLLKEMYPLFYEQYVKTTKSATFSIKLQ